MSNKHPSSSEHTTALVASCDSMSPTPCPVCHNVECDCGPRQDFERELYKQCDEEDEQLMDEHLRQLEPPLDLSQFEGHTPKPWVWKEGNGEVRIFAPECESIAPNFVLASVWKHDNSNYFPDAYLITHAIPILDRARELEAEVEELTREYNGRKSELTHTCEQRITEIEQVTIQRDDLAGALEDMLQRHSDLLKTDCECDNTHEANNTKCCFCTARAVLSKVKEGK